MDKSGIDSLSTTLTLFCVGCNERFVQAADGGVCPNCGERCTFTDTSGQATVITGVQGASEGACREISGLTDQEDPLVGRKLHVYECISLIGSGGMGRVYLALHSDLQRRCALKILSPKYGPADDEYVERFTQEGRAAAALVHPNIVTVHAVGHVQGTHFLEMEFISGQSLQDLINQQGALPVTRALTLAAGAADGLAAAHREGIIHRDVKPDNIMLNRRSVPKLSDFGLAKRVLNRKGKPVADGLCGTPNFMAPELFAGEPAGPASDVYALGICLFLMLTGELPYHAESLAQLRFRGREQSIPNLRDLRPDVGLEVASAVAAMTDPVPGNRPRDAVEVAQLLHAVLGHERDLESLLIEAFRNETSVTWQRNGDGYVLSRQLPAGRRQQVFLEPSSHDVGDRLLMFYSVCCHAEPEYYEQALRLNSAMRHGSLALREIDGQPHFVVVDTYPRATVDPEEIRRTVLEVAHHADQVEHQLTGLDRH